MRRRRPRAGRPPAPRPSRQLTAPARAGLPFVRLCLAGPACGRVPRAGLPFVRLCLAGPACGRRFPRAGRAAGRPSLAGPARRRLSRAGLAAVAVGLGLGVLAGCGTSGAASTPGAVQTCGTTRTGANVPVIVTIDHGSVSCATALRVENSYAAVVRTGQIRGTGGGAPVTVSGWTCQGFPTPEVLKTGETSVCRAGAAEVLAVLPPPSAAPS